MASSLVNPPPTPSDSSTKALPPSENGQHITWLYRYTKASTPAKLFLFVSFVHAVSMAVVGTVSIAWTDVPNLYGTLSIFVALCFLWFMLQGVLKENSVQLLCCILSAMLITFFLIWFYIIDKTHDIVASLAFGSLCFCAIYVILTPFVVNKFGWYRYNKAQSTNQEIMNLYYVYQRFHAMLLMDAELCIMLGLLVTFELRHHSLLGWIGNFGCLLFEVLWVIVGIRAVRTEHLLITQAFMACTIFLVAYVSVILYWIIGDTQYATGVSKLQFFVISVLALIVRALTMYWTVRCMRNFEQGLRSYFDQSYVYYVDFWGESKQKLLPQSAAYSPEVTTGFAGGDQTFPQSNNRSNDEQGLSGISSRSRINSDDFD